MTLSQTQLDQILRLQQEVLLALSREEPVEQLLERVCLMAEYLLENSRATLMLLTDGGLLKLAASTTMPDDLRALLTAGLEPGLHRGSCGRAAVTGLPVYVTDTKTDSSWAEVREMAERFGIHACWSEPVSDPEGRVVGAFALSSFEPRIPSEFHRRLLSVAASTISVILSRKAAQERSQSAEQRLEQLDAVISNSGDGVFITDDKASIVEVNGALLEITGYSEAELIGCRAKVFGGDLADIRFHRRLLKRLRVHGNWSGEVSALRRDGTPLVIHLNVTVMQQSDQYTNYVAVLSDHTQKRRDEKALVQALQTDPITNAGNKERLLLDLESARGSKLILLNVANFSVINSVYGWRFGDKLLRAVADRLRKLVPMASLYRINADEFALRFTTRDIRLMEVIERIRDHFFSRQVMVMEQGFNISFCFGACCDQEGAFGKAMQALQRARSEGSNRAHLFEAKKDGVEQERRINYIHWNDMLHQALIRQSIFPVFQGIRDNRTGKTLYFEALLRLEEDGVLHPPVRFLEVAQLSGLLPTLTRIVIDRSLAMFADTPWSVSINITEVDLGQEYLEEYLAEKTRVYGMEPQRIVLEILESVSATGKASQLAQLKRLKAAGYRLAIDDFGTEYSNFERIVELKVDKVKIDAKYIRDLSKRRESYEVVRAIEFFAKNVGIQTVAEFVDNPDTQAIIEQLGIDYSQGYLFHKPLRFTELIGAV